MHSIRFNACHFLHAVVELELVVVKMEVQNLTEISDSINSDNK